MIALVDPGHASTNLGDRIISEAIHTQFVDQVVAQGHEVVTMPLHGPIDDTDRRHLRAAADVVVSGTNLLSDHMRFRSPWNWPRADVALAAGKLTVLGAGWWQYQRGGVDWPTRRWMRELGAGRPWAVRDVYSADRLRAGRIFAVHTSCPTLWNVREQRLPGGTTRVVVTFTDYTQDRASDGALLRVLSNRFDEVKLWPQGPGDAAYFASLGVSPSSILEPTLAAFDDALEQPRTCYVGLRLHGGIRAAQLGVPSLILSVDNRAREIARSVGMCCPSRHALTDISRLIDSTDVYQLRIPLPQIERWLAQWREQ